MRTLAIALLLSGAVMWAQATTPQTPPASGQAQTGAGSAQSTHRMHHGQMGQGMGAQRMQQNMKAMTDQMRTKLDTMRSALDKVSDPNVKQALQADYDMWQTMYSHMQQMQASMQEHAQQHQQGMTGSENKPASGQAPPPQR